MNQSERIDEPWINVLEWLTSESSVSFDRVTARRAIQEARSAWPGQPEDRWWKWLLEASKSLGLRARVVELTVDQALFVAQETSLAIRTEGEAGPLLVIHRRRGRRYHVVTPLTGFQGRWVTRRELLTLLNNPARDDLLIWLAVEPVVTCQPLDAPEPATPWQRFWQVLSLEWPDIRVVFLFSVFVGIISLATPLAIETLVTTVSFGNAIQPVIVLALVLFAFLAFSALLQAAEYFVVELIQRRLFVRVAGDLAYRLPRLRQDRLGNKYPPELVNRFFEIVTVQKVVATLLIDTLDLLMSTLAGMVVLALLHPFLLGLEISLAMLVCFLLYVMGRGAVQTSIKESTLKYATAAWLEGLARCTVAVKHHGGADYALGHTDRFVRDYLFARRRHFRIVFRQIVFGLALFAIGTAVFLGVGGLLVIQGQLSLGQLVAAEFMTAIIFGSLSKLGKHLEDFYNVMASTDKLGMLFDLPLEDSGGLFAVSDRNAVELTMTGVNYTGPEGTTVLANVNLRVPRGTSVGIYGTPRCGKTTLAEILFGLRMNTSGSIQIDGTDIADLNPEALRRIAALAGPIEFFDGTIAENVHLDRPGVDSTKVREALRIAGLLDDVFLLPEGLDTQLNPAGRPLTGSQKRRLVLARAIAASPRLLIIDGLLDCFPQSEAEELLSELLVANGQWTLVLLTSHHHLAELCDQTLHFHDSQLSAAPL